MKQSSKSRKTALLSTERLLPIFNSVYFAHHSILQIKDESSTHFKLHSITVNELGECGRYATNLKFAYATEFRAIIFMLLLLLLHPPPTTLGFCLSQN